jgi:hypothetical protein
MSAFLERRIVMGFIISTEYVRRLAPFWQDHFLVSPELVKLTRWCLDFFLEYNRVPDRDIEAVYMDHVQRGDVDKTEAELIEEIFHRIEDDYGRDEQFNYGYLYNQTIRYLRQREIEQHKEHLEDRIARGEIERALEDIQTFRPQSFVTTLGLEVGSEEGYKAIEQAFAEGARPVVTYPGAFGRMINSHLIRGGFVAFLAPEKRGKTWLMTDIAFRGLRQKANVALFQAGDLTESQMLRRACIYLSHRSDDEQYCKSYWRPVGDCVRNQFDACTRSDRNCDHGIYDEQITAWDDDSTHQFERYQGLIAAAKTHREYQPCDSMTCDMRRPTVYLVEEPEREPLNAKDAVEVARVFFERYRRRFKLMTSPSDSLSNEEIRRCLDEWEYQDDFVPDIIIVDYADLMTARVAEFRHRQDAIWKGLRATSQARHALVVTATQADANSYRQNRLNLTNFSEDKRKFAHVTAMWGLNQDPHGREKELGILRINTLLVREGIFSAENDVAILQDLRSGRPFLESYDVR